MPPGMVSIRCFRSVGLFSRTKERPDSAATSRKRIGGGGAAARIAAIRPRIASAGRNGRMWLLWRLDLGFACEFVLLPLVALENLLIGSHGFSGLHSVAGRLIGARQ